MGRRIILLEIPHNSPERFSTLYLSPIPSISDCIASGTSRVQFGRIDEAISLVLSYMGASGDAPLSGKMLIGVLRSEGSECMPSLRKSPGS